jgi:hypothetical protein
MNERDVVRMRHMLDEALKVRQAMKGRTREQLDQDWMAVQKNVPQLIAKLESILPPLTPDSEE